MAKAKTIKCPKCDRTFSMAAHLGRHMRTMHGVKPAKAAKATKAAKPPARRRRRPAAARTKPAATFAADGLVVDMERYRNQLLDERARLDRAIAAIEESISLLGGMGGAAPAPPALKTKAATTTRRRGRPRGDGTPRQGSLKWYIDKVMHNAGRAMTVKEITEAVLKAGFKTSNQTLGKSVGIALTQMPNVKKIRRGVFALK